MQISTPTINQISIKILIEKDFPNTLRDVQSFALKFSEHFGFHVVNTTYHEFKPYGITFIAILSESHLAIHTWPEYKTIHVDLVSCKDLKKADVEAYIKLNLKSTAIEFMTVS